MKISEKMLEDWICEHPEETFWTGTKLIGRQIPVVHGIIDILMFAERTLVVELKARPVKEKDVGQVLRYTYDVKHELQRYTIGTTLFDNKRDLTFSEQIYSDLWSTLHGFEMGIESAVLPVLIGPSIDEPAMAAAEAAGIHTLAWSYDEDANWFEFELAIYAEARNGGEPFDDWTIEVSKEIDALCESDTQIILDAKIAELFGAKRWQMGTPRTLPLVTGVAH